MYDRITVFPLMERGQWVFRTSIVDHERIMILAFNHSGDFLMRFFTDKDLAKIFVESLDPDD